MPSDHPTIHRGTPGAFEEKLANKLQTIARDWSCKIKPLLDMLKLASMKVYLYGLAISCVLLYGLVILCGLYPSYLATRIHPAEALHSE